MHPPICGSRHCLAAWAAALAVVLASAVLLAQSGDPAVADGRESAPAVQDEADQAYWEGLDAHRAGNYEAALRHYRRSWEQKPASYVAANLGKVEARLEQWVAAAEHLSYALRHDNTPLARQELEELLAEVRLHVATLHVEVEPPGATVRLDGRVIGTSPLAQPVYVAQGEHSLMVQLAGYDDAKMKVTARQGEEQTVTLRLRGVPPASLHDDTPVTTEPAAAFEQSGTRRGRAKWRMPTVLTGAVLTATSVGLHIGWRLQASALDDDARALRADLGRDECSRLQTPRCVELADTLDRRDAAGVRANVTLGLAVGLGVATVVAAAWPVRHREPAASRIVAPWVGMRAGGLVVRGWF